MVWGCVWNSPAVTSTSTISTHTSSKAGIGFSSEVDEMLVSFCFWTKCTFGKISCLISTLGSYRDSSSIVRPSSPRQWWLAEWFLPIPISVCWYFRRHAFLGGGLQTGNVWIKGMHACIIKINILVGSRCYGTLWTSSSMIHPPIVCLGALCRCV